MIVAFTVSCWREEYLRRTLDSWARVRGVQDAQLLFCLEPHPGFPLQEFTAWVHGAFPGSVVEVNKVRLGCAANTRHAINRAFGLGGKECFAVVAEEDIQVSTGILEYVTWARDNYRSDGRVKAVCAHASRCAPAALASQVVLVPWFSPLVWGTWSDRLDYLCVGWDSTPGNLQGWDQDLRAKFSGDGTLSVFPVRSRAKHIGKTSTLHSMVLHEFWYEGSVSTCFERDYPPQGFTEIPRTPELGLVV